MRKKVPIPVYKHIFHTFIVANIKLNISTGNVDIYATDGCINGIIKLSNDNQAQALHVQEKNRKILTFYHAFSGLRPMHYKRRCGY